MFAGNKEKLGQREIRPQSVRGTENASSATCNVGTVYTGNNLWRIYPSTCSRFHENSASNEPRTGNKKHYADQLLLAENTNRPRHLHRTGIPRVPVQFHLFQGVTGDLGRCMSSRSVKPRRGAAGRATPCHRQAKPSHATSGEGALATLIMRRCN